MNVLITFMASFQIYIYFFFSAILDLIGSFLMNFVFLYLSFHLSVEE